MKLNILKQLIRCGTAAFCALLLAGVPVGLAQEETSNRTDAVSVASTPQPEGSTGETNAILVETNGSATSASTATETTRSGERTKRRLGDIVVFGKSVEVKPWETAGDVVVIWGTATVSGSAQDVVAIFGNIVVDGGSTRDAVSVLGNLKAGTGSSINGDAVAVMGNVTLSPAANVSGDAVAVGGGVEKSDDASVKGDVLGLPGFTWVGEYLEQCVFKLRPLAPGLGWLWVITGVFFLLYLLVAVAFPRPVNACVQEITRRPATTFLIGLLTKILVLPIVTLILVITGIGIFLIPFLSAAVMFAGIIGKIALLQYLGQQFGRQSGIEALQRPILAFVLGWIIITLLYLVPVVGFIVFGVTGLWAIGAAAMAMFGGTRKEMRQPPASPPGYPPPGFQTSAPVNPAGAAGGVPFAPMPVTSLDNQAQAAEGPPPVSQAAAPLPGVSATAAGIARPNMPEAWASPRAGFWERMAAAFLDVILVSILAAIVHSMPPLSSLKPPLVMFVVALAYFAGMWTWKGTTVGGVVLNLKVVRLDGSAVTFPVALVRGLMAAFSVVVLFLGFLWIAWDPEKQAWHDKLAGTVVVRQPRAASLVCF